jgi:P27 family predicted phage terminase small subunit
MKKAAGNPGKRPLNNLEAKFAPAMLACPAFLNADAKAEWKRITTELYNAGLLTSVDRGALVVYVEAWAELIQAMKLIKKNPLGMICVTDKGNYVQHPAVGIKHKAMEMILKGAGEFGMTPSARSRVQALEEGKQPLSLAEELFLEAQVLMNKKAEGSA